MKPLCSYPECPWRFNEEEHWPMCGHVNGHPHTNEVTHQHKPRRSQMKNPPIVALLCPSMHDMVDNGTKFKDEVWGEAGTRVLGEPIMMLAGRGPKRFYRLWKPEDEHKPDGWALIWKEIPGRLTLAPAERQVTLSGKAAGDYLEETHGQGTQGQGTEGLSGTLPDTGVPETAGREELKEEPDGSGNEKRRVGTTDAILDCPKPDNAQTGVHYGTLARIGVGFDSDSHLGLSSLAPDFGPDFLNLPEEFTLQDAVPWAAMVGKWEHGRQWYAGDLLLACEARFGHERLWGHSLVDGKTFVDLLGMTYQSLRNCQRVCQAFSPGERYPLSFGHHAACYRNPERDRLMEQATAEGWTVSQLREAATGHVEPETCICPSCGNTHRKQAHDVMVSPQDQEERR